MLPDRRHQNRPSALAFLLLSCLAGAAHGQTSADISLLSEYAGRGTALSTHPVAQLRVERDIRIDADGAGAWYAGTFASPVTLGGRDLGQLSVYGGRAQRLGTMLSWDAGATRNVYLRDSRWNYHEFYAGVTWNRLGARLFYSPAYYGDERSLYLDLNGAWPINERVQLAAHAGLLHPFEEEHGAPGEGGGRVDLRLALVTDVRDVSLQAGWQVKGTSYLPGSRRASALTASASFRF